MVLQRLRRPIGVLNSDQVQHGQGCFTSRGCCGKFFSWELIQEDFFLMSHLKRRCVWEPHWIAISNSFIPNTLSSSLQCFYIFAISYWCISWMDMWTRKHDQSAYTVDAYIEVLGGLWCRGFCCCTRFVLQDHLSEKLLLKIEENVRIQQGHIERYDGTVFGCE